MLRLHMRLRLSVCSFTLRINLFYVYVQIKIYVRLLSRKRYVYGLINVYATFLFYDRLVKYFCSIGLFMRLLLNLRERYVYF